MRHKNNIIYIFILFILVSCDITSGLYKEILEAQEMVKEQNFNEAVLRYKNILNRNPTKNIKIKLYLQLGDIYSIYLNNQVEALKYYEKILEDSNDPLYQVKVLEKIADINFEYLREFKKSKEVFKLLINFEPKLDKYDYYEFKHAVSVFNLNNFDEAIKLIDSILTNKNHSYYLDAYYYKGLSYFFQKDWENAINTWKKYIRTEKNKTKITEVKFLLANAYETSEKLKEAYNIYYSIIGEYPNSEVIKNRIKSLYNRRVARKR